jgi:NurA-like 5'-3' nuclease
MMTASPFAASKRRSNVNRSMTCEDNWKIVLKYIESLPSNTKLDYWSHKRVLQVCQNKYQVCIPIDKEGGGK